MLSSLIENVKKRAATVNAFLMLCDLRDEAFSDQNSTLGSFLIQRQFPSVHLQDDRIFRHCSIITHLYSVYEEFVENSLQVWLARMPKYYRFSQLDKSLLNAYRSGMAAVIRDIGKRQFRHLSLLQLLERYATCLRDEQPWQFVAEALTLHEINLRRSELERLFTVVGFQDFWHLLEGSRHIRRHIENADNGSRVEILLDNFVTYRNEASHGIPDDLLGSESLRQWAAFAVAICEAIAEVIIIKTLSFEKAVDPSCMIGLVTEKFRNNIIIARCFRGELQVGQQLYFLRPSSAITGCIESLQIEDQDVLAVRADKEKEVGMCISCEVKEGAEILSVSL